MSAKAERPIPIDRRADARLATCEGIGNDMRGRKGDAIESVRRERNRNGDAPQPDTALGRPNSSGSAISDDVIA